MTAEIQLTRGYVALVDDADFELLTAGSKWFVHFNLVGKPYARRIRSGKGELMHRVIMEPGVGKVIDHIDRNGLNNQRHNLRICTHAQNHANAGPNTNNTTGFRGVGYHIRAKAFQATIRHQGKQRWLGLYETPEEAARAYDAVALKLWGEFALLNFPSHANKTMAPISLTQVNERATKNIFVA